MNRILLIDDDMDDAGIFKEALEEVNPSIAFQYFLDGNDALHALSDKGTPLPDLIFLDINMPTLSGWDCLGGLKNTSALADIPVVMYTTSSHPKEKKTAIDMGATGFITKPHDYRSLKDIIAFIVETPVDRLAQGLSEYTNR
jgi:CheY-like chemotaxis protein